MKPLNDLSLHHNLISEYFPTLSAKDAWHEYKLSLDQIEFFHEFGYLSHIKIFESQQVEQLNLELIQLMSEELADNPLFYERHSNQSEQENRSLFHSLGHWRITKGFHDSLWNPRFVVAACQLLGNKAVRFWHDQLFCKPAKHGGVVAWHQDYSYWTRTTPMQHLTCWIGLDESTKENGCLYYIPKSHQWPLLDMPNITGDMQGIEKFLTPEQIKDFNKKVAIEMPKGYGCFHHPLMVHGSYENNSEISRRALVLNTFADGTKTESDQVLLKGVPTFNKGQKLEGQFFPLLFDPSDI